MATLEQIVEAEQAARDAQTAPATDTPRGPGVEVPPDGTEATIENAGTEEADLVEPDGQTVLVDRSEYEREDLAIDKVDGNAIDRIRITFSGTVSLDRSEPNDVALYNRLRLGREVTLKVEGRASGTGAKEATGRDGDLDVIVGLKTVTVTTVYVPAAEEL